MGGSSLVSPGCWWLPASLAVATSLQSLPLTSRGPAVCWPSPLLCSCKDTYTGLRSHTNPGRPHLDEILDVITASDSTLDLSSGGSGDVSDKSLSDFAGRTAGLIIKFKNISAISYPLLGTTRVITTSIA